MDDVVAVAARLRALHRGGGTVLVGIDGLGGSGKSCLAAALAAEMLRTGAAAVSVVHGDDFYLPSAERPAGDADAKPIGGDVDWRRLRAEVLEPLRAGRGARYRAYDWNRDALGAWHAVRPGGVALVEGVYALRPELRALYDVRIWVECPRAIRLARGLARDGEAARARWEEDWMPAEDRYVAACRPAASVDHVVSGVPGVSR
jgi:uridine kinase